MKKLIPILTAILLAFGSNGQAPAPYPILVDSQRDTVAGLQVFQANQITFRASYRSGNATNNLVAVTPFMYWQPYGPTNATVVTGRWTIVSAPSGTVDFAFTPADLNFATGSYTYQIGLNVSGGPNVIKQGSFIIKASQASIGASPIAFATTNVNWGAINWSGLPAYEYQTNTIAISNALNTRITANETGKVAKAGDTMTGNLGFTNSGLTSLDFIDFDAAPTEAISAHRLQWQADKSTVRLGLNANVNLDIGQQEMLYGRNDETNTIAKGEVVIVNGSQGDQATIKRASNTSEPLSSRTIGIAAESIAVNASGFVVISGRAYGLNTTNFVAGSPVYLGPNGTLITNLPAAPLHGVFIGVVERSHQNAGQIFVAIQNYQELRELSDVFINGISNNHLIVYNSASSRWQNASLASLGISTTAGITVESDPIFVAASNSFYPRSNPSNFITTSALSGYATGTPLYVETDPAAVTNVTASGRITATPSGKQVALTFDASGLATGTPIYSVAGLATGTPLYTFTETDTIATNRLTNYYTITAADAKFATGTPLYVEAAFNANSNRITVLEGYTNRAASALSSSVWASADSTTNYQSRVQFVASSNAINARLTAVESYTNRAALAATTNFVTNALAAYLPLAGGSMSGPLNFDENVATNILRLNGTSGRAIDFDALEIRSPDGSWSFTEQPTIPGYQTITGTVNAANLTNTAVLGFASTNTTASLATNVAARLASNIWASADSTSNYASRITFGSFTSSYATADSTTNYASRITFNATSNSFNSRISNVATGAVYVTNLSAIAGSGLTVISNQLVNTNVGFVTTNTLTNYLALSGGTLTGPLTVGTNVINFSAGVSMQFLAGGIDITASAVRASVFNGSFTGNGANITNIQSGSLPNLSGTYLLLSTYLNDTNRLQIQSGSVTQGQNGTFGTSYISTTNYWISLGSTNWVKFEGKLNSF